MKNNFELFKSSIDVEEKTQEGCGYLKTGDFQSAEDVFMDLLKKGADSVRIDTGIKCAKYWNHRISDILKMKSNLDRGKYILDEWGKFIAFLNSSASAGRVYEEKVCDFAKQYIITLGVEDLIEAYKVKNYPDTDLLILIAESFIQLSDYHKAIETIEYARAYRKRDAYILALLADSYYGCNEIRRAKVFFREAFFLRPEAIPLEKIQCQLIKDIIAEIKNAGVEYVAPWISVYGMIGKHFNIRKELSLDEAKELVNDVNRMENEYKQKMNKNFLPYLLSRYLYLIDYLELQVGNKDEAMNIKNRFKAVDPAIYEWYKQENR